jgi:hypothetical protein
MEEKEGREIRQITRNLAVLIATPLLLLLGK